MVRFVFDEHGDKIYRVLHEAQDYAWIIECKDPPGVPHHILRSELEQLEEAPIPECFYEDVNSENQKKWIEKRYSMLKPLIESTESIVDIHARNRLAKKVAQDNGVSEKTVRRLYYSYLAFGKNGLCPKTKTQKKSPMTQDQRNMVSALSRYYYSIKKMSLVGAYEMMLVDSYMDKDGILKENHPTYAQFRYFYAKHRDQRRKIISRSGIKEYQQNYRPLLGNGDSEIDYVGLYEIDATIADVYIVSRYSRQMIGRPYVYLAIDVASKLIAGFAVSLSGNSETVLSCLRNAACDKVEFCRKYGVEIDPEMWPSSGLPSKLYTDRGREFTGGRVKELCSMFSMEITTLPGYRPDLKGYVEKIFDCLQQRYMGLLRGDGAVEKGRPYTGVQPYMKTATIDIYDYTRILIQAVLYYNCGRVIDGIRPAEMIVDQVRPIACEIWNWYERKKHVRLIRSNSQMMELLLLSRASATVTRRGVEFQNLYYANDEVLKLFAKTGMANEEQLQIPVAYDPEDNSQIYWIRDGIYIKLELTLASNSLRGLSYDEVNRLIGEERRVVRWNLKQQVQVGAACSDAIRKIIRTAKQKGEDQRIPDKKEESKG